MEVSGDGRDVNGAARTIRETASEIKCGGREGRKKCPRRLFRAI